MIKTIVTDQFLLGQKSENATLDDLYICDDLKDTLAANHERCVGMAANMIGILKKVIIFQDGSKYTVMFNPEIMKSTGPYETEEGCLCHKGTQSVKRYKQIKVAYEDEYFKKKIKTYSDYTAQIIQHEIDHCLGILI